MDLRRQRRHKVVTTIAYGWEKDYAVTHDSDVNVSKKKKKANKQLNYFQQVLQHIGYGDKKQLAMLIWSQKDVIHNLSMSFILEFLAILVVLS